MKSIIKLVQKIRSSFTLQLTIWVGGGVLLISAVVIFLLAQFSQQVIRDESVEITQQALANMKQSLPQAQIYVAESKATREDSSSVQEDQQNYTFRVSICDGRFSIVAVCPVHDFYDKYSGVQIFLVTWGIFGVLILLLILWMVIAYHLLPLHKLADTAQSIADGHLNEAIPDTNHQDEIGQLQNSLSKMQLSLAEYMYEMRQKQDTLNRQSARLEEAYSEAQEYERIKDKFLHDMTSQMTKPVETLCQNTYSICANCKSLSKADMAKRHIDILETTEKITHLLDQSFTAAK